METKIGIRFAVAIALLLTTRGLPVQCQHQNNDDDDDNDDNDGYGGLPMLAIPPEAIPYLSANGGNGVNEIVHTVKVIRHGGIEGHDEGTANVDRDATVRMSGGEGVRSDGNGRITRKTTVVTGEKRPNRRVSSSSTFESTTHTEGSSRTAAASVSSSADSLRSGSPVVDDNNGATMTTITTTTAADGFTPPSGDVGLARKKTTVIERRRGSDGGSVTFSSGKTDMAAAAANDDGYDESLGSMSGGMVETSRISKGRPSRRVKTTIIEHDDGNDDEYAIRPNVIAGDDGRSRAGSSYASGLLQRQWEQQQWEQQQWEQQQWEQQQWEQQQQWRKQRQRHGSNSAQMDFDDTFRGSHAAMGYRQRGGYDNDDFSSNNVKYYITTSKNGGGGGGGGGDRRHNGMNGGGYAVEQGYMSASAERADDSYNSDSSRKRCNKKKGKKKKGGKKRSLEKQCACGRKLNKRDSGSESDESETESFERLANDRNRHSSTTTADGDDFAEFDGLMPVVMPPPPEGFQSPVINIVGPPSPSANSFIDVNRPPPPPSPSDPLLSANDDDPLTVYIKRIIIGPGLSTNDVPGVRRSLPGFNPYDFVSSRLQPPPLPAITGVRSPPSPASYPLSGIPLVGPPASTGVRSPPSPASYPLSGLPLVGPPAFTGVPKPRWTDDAAGDDSEFVLNDASSSESSTAFGDTTDEDGAQELYARSVETGEITAGDNRPETRSDRYESSTATVPDVRLIDRQLPLPLPVVQHYDRDFSLRPPRYPFPDVADLRRPTDDTIFVLPASLNNGCPYPVEERRFGPSQGIYLAVPVEPLFFGPQPPDKAGWAYSPIEIKLPMTNDFVARDSDDATVAEPEATRPETGYEPAYGSDRNTLGDAETTGPTTTMDGDGIRGAHILQPRSSWAPPVSLPYRYYGNPAADWTKYLPDFMKGSQKERAAYSGTTDAPNWKPAVSSHSHSDGIGSKHSKTTNTMKTTGGDNPVEVYVSQTQSTVPDDKSYSYSYSYSQ